MPNTTSAIRRIRRVQLQTAVNRLRKSKYRSTIKQMTNYIAANKIKEAKCKNLNKKSIAYPDYQQDLNELSYVVAKIEEIDSSLINLEIHLNNDEINWLNLKENK